MFCDLFLHPLPYSAEERTNRRYGTAVLLQRRPPRSLRAPRLCCAEAGLISFPRYHIDAVGFMLGRQVWWRLVVGATHSILVCPCDVRYCTLFLCSFFEYSSVKMFKKHLYFQNPAVFFIFYKISIIHSTAPMRNRKCSSHAIKMYIHGVALRTKYAHLL